MLDAITLILAFIGCIYIGITAAVLGLFTAVKRMEKQEQANRDAMDEAVELCETELDATVVPLSS